MDHPMGIGVPVEFDFGAADLPQIFLSEITTGLAATMATEKPLQFEGRVPYTAWHLVGGKDQHGTVYGRH